MIPNNENDNPKRGLLTTSVVFPSDVHHDRYFSHTEMRKRLFWQVQELMADLMGIDIYGGKDLDIDPERGSYTFQFLGITNGPADDEGMPGFSKGFMREMKLYMLVLHNQHKTMKIGDVCIKSAIEYPGRHMSYRMPEVPVFSLSNSFPSLMVSTAIREFEPRTLFIKGKTIEMWERTT